MRAVRLANPKSITISDDTYVGGGGHGAQSIGYLFEQPFMIHQLTYTEGKHFWVTCSFVVLPISLDLTRKASPFQDGGYWVIGPNVEVDIDGEWVPVTNQRCSPNLPSEGGDDWHQNSETSFEQYVYTFDPVYTTVREALPLHRVFSRPLADVFLRRGFD